MHCEIHGGDVLAFLMMRDGMDFKRAAQGLGAWKDGGLSQQDRERIERDRRNREREWQRISDLEAENKRQRIEVRDQLHTLEKIQRECSRDLSRLRDLPDGSPEKENAWVVLSLLCDPIREAEVSYRELSGIEVYP